MSIWYFIPVLLGLTIVIAVWTAIRLIFWAQVRQNVAGAILLSAIACFLLGYLVQLLTDDYQVMLIWDKILVIGLSAVYPALLIFILYFTGNGQRVTLRLVSLLVLLSTFPIVIYNLPATSAWFVQVQGFVTIGPLHAIKLQLGWANWLATVIAQVEGIIGAVILARNLRRARPGYRRYIASLFISQVIAYVTIWMEIAGANPIAPISIFNLSIIPTCLTVSWAIFALRVGQSLPLMREKVVEIMDDSVIVLDSQNFVVYLNQAAIQMLQLPSGRARKVALAQLAPAWADHLAAKSGAGNNDETILLREMIYNIRRSVIEDWKGEIIGQVLVFRNVTDREHVEQALQARATELARSSAFTQSLSLLSARVAESADLEQVYSTLRNELHRLELECCVGLRTPGQSGYSIEYMSLDQPILQLLEKHLGFHTRGFRLPELGEIGAQEWVEESGAIFVPRLIDNLRLIFDHFPESIEQLLLNTVGVSLNISSLTFRLIAQGEDFGFIAIWGPSLRREDLSPLSTFAAQVSAAIQKARLIQNEHQRVTELERTNRLILSLTQVAARFEANLNLQQIMEILGAELRKLDLTCVVAFIDPTSDELVGRYTSTAPVIWQTAEKITGANLDDFRIPYKDWQALDPEATGPASVIDDPLEYSSKIITKIPKMILKHGIQMVGITPQTPAVWLPLRASSRNIGILVIWGIQEPHRYLTVFSLFAQQIANAIEKARLLADLEALKSFNEGIVQSAAEAIIMFTPQGQITFANPATGSLFGVDSEDLIGKEWTILVPPDDIERAGAWWSGRKTKSATWVEFRLRHQDGHSIPVLINVQTIDKDGKPDSILVSLMDIQERIQAEQQIRASMAEKEALLKEIHHRVKNNLQIVSSLLNLQASSFKDQQMIEAFRESQNRVRSMALIHEMLYRSDNLGQIRFDIYIKELANSLMRTYNDPARDIRLEIKADSVNMDIDTAIPCGLMINELVTNSLKHGFTVEAGVPITTTRRIGISLSLLPEHHIQLTIADNGKGFPPDLDFRKTSSLGLQLVASLTDQLDGEVSFTTDQGARTEINFTSESAYVN